jgi:hypothetical protein
MLPDYPQTKTKLMNSYTKTMAIAHRLQLGPFATIKAAFMHEGEADVLTREDGSTDEMTPEHLQSKGLIPADPSQPEALRLDDVIRALVETARGLADEQVKMIIRRIEETTEKTGNRVGPHSDPVEQLFQMISTVAIDFDEDRRPIWANFFIGPNAVAEKMQAARARIDSMPELRNRMELLIELKRREFLDREADRKLVD